MATGVFILAVIAGILIFFECVQRAVCLLYTSDAADEL